MHCRILRLLHRKKKMGCCFWKNEAELEGFLAKIFDRKLAMCYLGILVFLFFLIFGAEQLPPDKLVVLLVPLGLVSCILWLCCCHRRQRQREGLAASDDEEEEEEVTLPVSREHAVDMPVFSSSEQLHAPRSPFAPRDRSSESGIILARFYRDHHRRGYEDSSLTFDEITPATPTTTEEYGGDTPRSSDDGWS